jgi:hypothetical protein
MADYFIPNNFRLSSSAFLWGRLVFTDYNTGCFRKILAASQNVRTPVNPKYGRLGKWNEDRYADYLTSCGGVEGTSFFRETEVKRVSSKVPGVTISGHADFIFIGADGKTARVDELKSVTSKNVRRDVIKNGKFKTENLAQLVAYMGELDCVHGKLIYSYYENTESDPYAPKLVDERTFVVHIDDYGRIEVDGEPTKFTAYDVIAHRNVAVSIIGSHTIRERPYMHDAPFGSPCHFCEFKPACDANDSGEIEGAVAFVERARKLVGGKKDE